MYKSPIEKIYSELQTQIVQEDENTVMKAVRNVGVNVDKEELIRALQYDCNQYAKGYEDGKNDVIEKLKTEIEKKHTRAKQTSSVLQMNAYTDCLQMIDNLLSESGVK